MAVRPVLVALTVAAAAACGGARAPSAGAPTPTTAALRELDRGIDAILSEPELRRSSWGIAVKSLSKQDTLYARDPHKLLLPASNTKVVTLAIAAERLGWDFSFETELATLGPIDRGTLYGDLVVTGSGDPSIDDWDGRATSLFQGWAAELRGRGITVVTGGVVGDDNRLPDATPGAGWAWDDLDRSYAASVGALQFNQNTARLRISPGAAAGDPALITIEPTGSGLAVRGGVQTTSGELPAAVETRRGNASLDLEVRGSVPLGAPAIVRNVSVPNPTLYFARALHTVLLASGIEVRGEAIDVDDLSEPSIVNQRTVMIRHRSPSLSALAVTMMKVSQNLFAETILQAAGGPGAVRTTLSTWNVEDGTVVVADGSGLSRYNMATAEALVTILTHLYRDNRLREPFELSLPIAGRDGTLGGRMVGTAAEGNARAKTGAFSNARGLTGYVRSADGEPLVFSILANNFGTTPDIIERASDAIVVKLAEFSRR